MTLPPDRRAFLLVLQSFLLFLHCSCWFFFLLLFIFCLFCFCFLFQFILFLEQVAWLQYFLISPFICRPYFAKENLKVFESHSVCSSESIYCLFPCTAEHMHQNAVGNSWTAPKSLWDGMGCWGWDICSTFCSTNKLWFLLENAVIFHSMLSCSALWNRNCSLCRNT